ncbi:bacterioferritin [Oleiphilus sp. HI0009]|uniref:bacterioferritin n=1 Tax=unclassified Oleiphilus TaxID=2631174 RepID=UPI0007C27BB3|nr:MULTISPECIES: bacterioferritin [unclassified Oleiphilus]KZX76460.1 bacterioferritin [Oleiphilus sp. HI0009]MCH2159360.1 bacterioferritin [Oleiphilaceae bacterium]KZX79038.1 bacterioferritin [Oleiphilus sp. HI0009]KZY65727.1 bacterioferritin [Oleiphilus sp. HI0066]KZY66245.1 bacterioferritin [Oleiphilus sp. HI0066]
MQGDVSVIQKLNDVLADELISINQYFLHARMAKNWGLSVLDKVEYKKSIKDMKQADALIERILFLEGIPNLQKLGKLYIGEDVPEILSCDLRFQTQSLATLRDAIEHCESQRDYVSRDVLRELLSYEEEHFDWIETQRDLIEKMGLENYTQSLLGEE